MEATQVCIDKWMDKQNVILLLLSLKKEGNGHMQQHGFWEHHAKWNSSVLERQKKCVNPFISRISKKTKSQRQKVDGVYQGLGGGVNGELLSNRYRVSILQSKKSSTDG